MADFYVKNGVATERFGGFDYTLGQLVVGDRTDSTFNYSKGWVYECTTAGHTADFGSGTTFPTTVGGTATDGTCVWTARLPDSWARALPYLELTVSKMVAGDTCYVASTHVEDAVSQNTTITTVPGTRTLSVLEATPPVTLAPGALVKSSSNRLITIAGYGYVYGLYAQQGTVGSVGLTVGGTNGSPVLEKCKFILGNAGALTITPSSTGSTRCVQFIDTDIVLNGVAIAINLGKIVWEGGSVTGVFPSAALFTASTNLAGGVIQGVDFSAMPTTLNFTNFNASSSALTSDLVIKNCKLPTGWSGSLIGNNPSFYGARIAMYNTDSGDTNYRMQAEDSNGVIRSETGLVRGTGASDGTTSLSWKMTSSANVRQGCYSLVSGDISYWNDTVGAPVTVTLEVLTDSATALTDADIGLLVEYPKTAGSPLGSMVRTMKPALSAPTALPASAASWTTTGMANPQTRKLSATFTPTKKGVITVRVRLYKPSTTVYVDPFLTVT